MKITHCRQQWAVGHGFFHTAWIDVEGKIYRYVYDCGSRKSPSVANQRGDDFLGIESLDGTARPDLDMLVISHFHADHVNGVPNLFQKFNVRRLVIPYLGADTQIVALAQFAAESPDVWNEFHELVTDPRAWANAHNGEGTEIIQVRSSEGGEAPPAEPTPPPEEGNGFSFGALLSAGQPKTARHNPPVPVSDKTPAAIFAAKMPVWTFRFYVQDIHTLGDTIIKALLQQFGLDDKRELLDKLNDQAWIQRNWSTIEACFQSQGSSKQNGTTLCMFSGPDLDHPRLYLEEATIPSLPRSFHYPCWLHNNIGWLGTGDAMFKGANHYPSFEHHFAGLIENTWTVSIPHHGSIHNYHPRLARIGHLHVITADAADAKHPAPEIRRHILSACGNPMVVTADEQTQLVERFSLEFLR